jgi:PleD family two-component response regulator
MNQSDTDFDNSAILVVDDFSLMRDIVVQHLKRMGFTQIHTASNGADALRMLEYKPIKLILSDWSMPVMTGLELLVAVKQKDRLRSIPFIMVTAELHRDRVVDAIKAGVHDFILKPFKPGEFSRKVNSALFGTAPKLEPAPATATGIAAKTPERAAATVLIVDDMPDNLTLASALLRDRYTVKMATRGEKALQLCQSAAPDLVLLDIMMPEMDGFEVCRRLKADSRTAHIPVIFLTALNDVDKTVAGLSLGAVDYVAKPIEPEILKARVATALRISQAHEDMREHYDLAVENARLRDEIEHITRHDLKNPLAAIIGLSFGLLDGAALDATQSQQVKAITKAASDLLGLIDISGDLLKMEQGRYQLKRQPVDPVELLERIAEECRLSFAAKQIVIKADFPIEPHGSAPVIEGEPLLLYSMMHNLVKNAAEAVQSGQVVSLEIDCVNGCRIRIHNPGTVPTEIAGRFFEKYATYGKEGGTGLGTYSAKLISQAHGADIAMETSESAGTTVTVNFPPSHGSDCQI